MCAGGKHRAERIDCQEMIPASRPPARRHASDSPIPANSDCTNNKLPPRDNNCGADSHSASTTKRPSSPAFHAHAVQRRPDLLALRVGPHRHAGQVETAKS